MPDYYVDYLINDRLVRGKIDFNKGLGRFLVNAGVLDGRVLLPEGEKLVFEPGYTYRRYFFNQETRRFEFDLQFTTKLLDRGYLTWDGTELIHRGRLVCTASGLGIYNEEADLNIILSKRARRS